jgi:radical SAM protein with 4Fe4S-binding SPASM domain
MYKKRPPGFMDMQLFRKLVHEVKDWGVGYLFLHRFGEPFMHPDAFEMIRYAKDTGIERVEMYSNGTLLNEKKAELLIESGLDQLTISFEGADKETYESIRVGAKYDTVIENIKRIVSLRNLKGAKKPRIRIHSIITDRTIGNLSKERLFWKSIADEYHALPGFDYGNIEGISVQEKEEKWPCLELMYNLVVLWDGRVTACCVDSNADLEIASADDSLRHIWNHPRLHEIRQCHFSGNPEKLNACRKCEKRFVKWPAKVPKAGQKVLDLLVRK